MSVVIKEETDISETVLKTELNSSLLLTADLWDQLPNIKQELITDADFDEQKVPLNNGTPKPNSKALVEFHDLPKQRKSTHADQNLFGCLQCGKRFPLMPSLMRHMKKYHIRNKPSKKPFCCEICKKCYAFKQGLAKHLCVHPGESTPKPMRCEICKKGFRSKHDITTHIHSHLGLKLYACRVCGKSYSTKDNLRRHTLIHVFNKLVNPSINSSFMNCHLCAMSFRDKTSLKYHILKHSGEKPFKCNYCEKAYLLRGDLTLHERTHTGVKPYSCEICYKAFKQGSKLKRHMLSHSKEKSYQCNLCHNKYRYSWDLTNHLRKLHDSSN